MKTKKLVLIIIAVILALIILGIVLWVKFAPTQEMEWLLEQEEGSAISEVLCVYPVKVTGDSMDPLFKNGETINFNKCFEPEALEVEQVVTYKNGPVMKIGVIREIVEGESGRYYQISPEGRQGDINDVFPDNIVAVYNE